MIKRLTAAILVLALLLPCMASGEYSWISIRNGEPLFGGTSWFDRSVKDSIAKLVKWGYREDRTSANGGGTLYVISGSAPEGIELVYADAKQSPLEIALYFPANKSIYQDLYNLFSTAQGSKAVSDGSKEHHQWDIGNYRYTIKSLPKKASTLKEIKEGKQPFRVIISAGSESSSKSGSSSYSLPGIRPEFKQFMDSYEAFIDEYIAFMKKYEKSSNPMSMMADYTTYMQKLIEFSDKADEWNDDDDLTTEELLYYTEVSLRIDQKLYNSLDD